MKILQRILRALFIRMVFIAYSLLCIWRVTVISSNNLYWLMLISVLLMLVETAIVVWLRTGKEFEGFLPSVAFFLVCVVPSVWIINLNDATQKANFYKTTLTEDSNMKEYATILSKRISVLMNDSAPEHARVDMHRQLTEKVFASLKKPPPAAVEVAKPAAPVASNATVAKVSAKGGGVAVVRHNASHAQTTPEPAGGTVKKNETKTSRVDPSLRGQLECCEVNVSYSFQEGILQRLFVQLLLIILVVTRWLVTHNGLSINQHSFLLVISLANMADILDFYSYASLEIIYLNTYLLYVVLFITSLSLLQYIFLQESFDLDTRSSSAFNSNFAQSLPFYNWDKPHDLQSFQDDNYPTAKSLLKNNKSLENDKKNNDKNLFGLQAILKQYQVIKEKFQPPGSDPSQMCSFNDNTNFLNDMWRNDKITLERRKQLFNKKHCDMSNLRRFFACGEKQSESVLLVLLLRLVFHDAWFLAFRVFFISKLGLAVVLNQKENILFFAVKNALIIIAQIYKVFCATRKDSFKSVMANLRLRPNPHLLKGNFKSDINLSQIIDRSNSIYFSSEINESNMLPGERLTNNPYLYFKKPEKASVPNFQRSQNSLHKLSSPQYLFSKSPITNPTSRFANIYPGYPLQTFPFGGGGAGSFYQQNECIPYVKSPNKDELAAYDLSNDDDKNSTYQRCRADQAALKKASYASANEYDTSCRLMNESTVSEYYPPESQKKMKAANDFMGFYMGPRRPEVDEFVPKMMIKDQGPFFSSAGKAMFGLPDYRKSRDSLFQSYKRDKEPESPWDKDYESHDHGIGVGMSSHYKASKI